MARRPVSPTRCCSLRDTFFASRKELTPIIHTAVDVLPLTTPICRAAHTIFQLRVCIECKAYIHFEEQCTPDALERRHRTEREWVCMSIASACVHGLPEFGVNTRIRCRERHTAVHVLQNVHGYELRV